MRSLGGMARFVQNGWAGKDFTHINYAGGQRVAWSLYDAILSGAQAARERERICTASDNVIEETLALRVDSLFHGIAPAVISGTR